MFNKVPLLPHVFLICAAVVLTMLTSPTSNTAHPVFQAPTNDNFANAQPILGAPGIINGTNVGATKEPGEPNHAGSTGGSSVWYRWQAPGNGRFVFSTYESTFDTVIAVYSGQPLANNLVASNNDEESHLCFEKNIRVSRVAFNATGGVFYHITIDRNSAFGDNGNIVLRWGRSATISGGFTSASGGISGPAETIRLEGDTCRDASQSGVLNFPDLLIGGHYTIFVSSSGGRFWAPWPGNKSISPLAGDVLDLRFYLTSPVGDVAGTVWLSPGAPVSGVTVTRSSGPPGNQTRTVTTSSSGSFNCSSLPILGTYLVTPSKQDFVFSPSSASIQLPSSAGIVLPPFIAIAARTISGRVMQPNGTGISGVSISLGGSQTGSTATDANGNYSFAVAPGGNYTVTPSNTNFVFAPENRSFSNLTANQTADFTANFLLQLLLDDMGQVGALDSVLLLRDPFPVINSANLLNPGVDRNTRVAIFLSNFQPGPGESPSSVVINLVGSNSQSYDIPAEDVRPLPDGLTRVTFRLPDGLTPGTCTLLVKARGLTSNLGPMIIK